MKYELRSTDHFDRWFETISDKLTRARILNRLDTMTIGHFGDHKAISTGLFELRLFFGPGYRIYYTIRGREIVLLLVGGDKSTQGKDIKKAKEILEKMEE